MSPEDAQTRKLRLAETWLEAAVCSFEVAKRQRGRFNISAAQWAHETAQLLGFDDAAARLEALLTPLTVADLLDGAITNIARTPDMAGHPLKRSTLEEIESKFPPFHGSYVEDVLSSGGAHLQACKTRDYAGAVAKAQSELDEVEVTLVQMLQGDFDEARRSLQRFPARRRDLLTVFAIELYRRNRFDEADGIQTEVLAKDSTWAPTHLTLGVAERVPWRGYPFPDY